MNSNKRNTYNTIFDAIEPYSLVTDLLKSPEVAEAIKAKGIKLLSFKTFYELKKEIMTHETTQCAT